MSSQKVLVVEDHRDTRELLKYNLSAAGFDVAAAEDGQLGLNLAQAFKPDIILLDLMMPGTDGLEVCRQLKGDPGLARIPVIILTAKGEEVDKIVGLELGADDYVVKPFSPRELVLRIKAILRRHGAPEPNAPKFWEREGLKIDFEAHQISIDDEETSLTATEFKLLTVLISGAGKVQTRDNLLDTVWDTHFEGYSRTVDTHVRRLRQKLGPYASWIETIRGVGYRFKA
ncbi:DNA-binding response regulator [Pseudodesulfovibrio nedwellii]|uniref:DNA-binding response regulator n=1 Tax=Pseudodesulfovibrio nedwellii TaxID=2973072 RepID=A0ABM8B300_9BACT|nr:MULTISPECIES: response regulator transcription factor [Pseudodesulfovibrio]BDQ38159.1 DNA-binding response regulator [Pseudodesulfovibrio nedwellii]